jgi:hypothetical protein
MTSRILLAGACAVLAIHGLIHVLGTVVYLRVAEIDGFAFKTTLLAGRVDLGEPGIRVFGALWILPAAGFLVSAVGLWFGWWWWLPAVVASIVVSVILTTADWNVAFAGAIADIAILVLLLFAGREARLMW